MHEKFKLSKHILLEILDWSPWNLPADSSWNGTIWLSCPAGGFYGLKSRIWNKIWSKLMLFYSARVSLKVFLISLKIFSTYCERSNKTSIRQTTSTLSNRWISYLGLTEKGIKSFSESWGQLGYLLFEKTLGINSKGVISFYLLAA